MAGTGPPVIRLSPAEIRALAREQFVKAHLAEVAEDIRDRARATASGISPRLADAIIATVVETDGDGAYVDLGYDKSKPGWVLWFHEVGTSKHPATPHLRPAAGLGS